MEKLSQKPRPSSRERKQRAPVVPRELVLPCGAGISALAATWSRLLSGVSRALRWKMLESRPGPGQLALDGVPPRQGRGNGPTMTGRGWGYLSAVPSLFQVLLSFQTSIRCMKPGDAKPQATPYILDASTEGWERQARDLGLMSV